MSIYLKVDANEEDKNEVLKMLQSSELLEDIQFVNRDRASDDFKKMFGEYSAGIITVDEMIDLVPESFSAKLKTNFSVAGNNSFLNLKNTLLNHAFVEEVFYGGEWLVKFKKLDGALKILGLALILVLSLAVALISALMVRSWVDESKNEIEVYSLIGATRWLIYGKYLRQYLFFFLLSLLGSIFLCFGLFYILKNKFLVSQGFVFIADNLQFLTEVEILIILSMLFVFVFTGAALSLKSTMQRLSLFSYE